VTRHFVHHPVKETLMAFMLNSPDIAANSTISAPYVYTGCGGGNLSPELRWSGAPAGTKSYAITIYDPDAPTGSGWWHWLLYNIPAATSQLPRGAGTGKATALPPGALQGMNDYSQVGYGGPCPPEGSPAHHYVFTIYALKAARLELNANASGALIGFNINANMLAKASFTATYGRAARSAK
jgi:Raf kinase inhibitor-like YbhB/YbcL family protein